MSNQNFRSGSANTVSVLASSNAGVAATQVSTGGNQPAVYVANPNAFAVAITLGSSSAAATLPTTSAPATGLVLPPNSGRVFGLPPNPAQSYLSAISSSGAGFVYATPGTGS